MDLFHERYIRIALVSTVNAKVCCPSSRLLHITDFNFLSDFFIMSDISESLID